MERWNKLTSTLLKQTMAQMYTTRTVNLISTLQLSLTGQRFYFQELMKSKGKKLSSGGARGSRQGPDNFLALMNEATGDDESEDNEESKQD
jgi:hypothetical protein